MTKKRFLLISLLMAILPLSNVCFSVFAAIIPLEVRYIDPNENKPNGPKTPVLVPEVSIDDYVLTVDDSCLGCELRLVDENDNVVYTTTITSNTLVLPSYLSGEYELQIIRGIYCFYGYICL